MGCTASTGRHAVRSDALPRWSHDAATPPRPALTPGQAERPGTAAADGGAPPLLPRSLSAPAGEMGRQPGPGLVHPLFRPGAELGAPPGPPPPAAAAAAADSDMMGNGFTAGDRGLADPLGERPAANGWLRPHTARPSMPVSQSVPALGPLRARPATRPMPRPPQIDPRMLGRPNHFPFNALPATLPRIRRDSAAVAEPTAGVRVTDTIWRIVHDSLAPKLRQDLGLSVNEVALQDRGDAGSTGPRTALLRELSIRAQYPEAHVTADRLHQLAAEAKLRQTGDPGPVSAIVLTCCTRGLQRQRARGTPHVASANVLLRRVMYPVLSTFAATSVHASPQSICATFDSIWCAIAAAVDTQRALAALPLGPTLLEAVGMFVTVGGSFGQVELGLQGHPGLLARLSEGTPPGPGQVIVTASACDGDVLPEGPQSFLNVAVHELSALYGAPVVVGCEVFSETGLEGHEQVFWSVQVQGLGESRQPDLSCANMVQGPQKRFYALCVARFKASADPAAVTELDALLREEFAGDTFCLQHSWARPLAPDSRPALTRSALTHCIAAAHDGGDLGNDTVFFATPREAILAGFALANLMRAHNDAAPPEHRLPEGHVLVSMARVLALPDGELCLVDDYL